VVYFKIPFHHKDYFILKDFKKFVTKQEEKRSYVKLLNFIIPFLLPSLLLFLLFLAFNYYINQYGSNLFFIIFWFWLIFLALVNLSYSLSFHYKKGKIEYYTPLLSHFKSYNLSGFIILLVLVIGLIYFGIIFLVLGFSGVDFVGLIFVGPIPEYVDIFGFIIPGEWIIIGVTLAIVGFFIYLLIQILGRGYPVIIAPFQIVYVYHKFNKAKKLYILHYLNKYLQQENLDWKEKNYYLQLIIEIDKIPITTIDFFTKLIALLTFLISIVPPYLIPLFQ